MRFDDDSKSKLFLYGGAGIGLIVLVILIWFLTAWIISPGPNEFFVLVRQTGDPLPPGRILADPGQKGVQRALHSAGWAVYSPIWWDTERHKTTTIPPGSVGILVAQDGETMPQEQVLAKVLERDAGGNIKRCQKGILEEVLMPGTYRIHPYWFKVETKPAISIEPGKVGVVTALTGALMDPGAVLAKPGQRGIQEKVLNPGTHYLNPYAYKVEIAPAVNIAAGSVGVVVSQQGEALPPGQLLAKEGQRGIREKVLEPGLYFLNPYAFKVDIVPAVNIPAGSVGVVTAKVGNPLPSGHLLAKEGERGVREKVLEPGLYYLNPYEIQADPISLRSHRLDLLKEGTHDESIQFPSNDGFPIDMDAMIEWRIKSERVAEVFSRIGNETQILDNIIRPNARSISRIEGSKYKATDFIQGINREKFEQSFFLELSKVCEAKGVEVLRALVRRITVPEEISRPIREAEVARQEKLRNIEQIETQKSAANLAKEKALVEQQTKQINAETEKIVKETEAKQQLSVADIALKTAEKEAAAIVSRGKGDAEVVLLKKKAEAEGYKAVVDAFGGGANYAMFNFTQMVSEHTSFVFAPVGEGTFWTDPQAFFKLAGAKALQEKSAEKKSEHK